MRRRFHLILSTTSTLEGWEIEKYLGPVSAHMVVGTGVLTDFFSGISDVFGGRSSSYRDKIQEIEEEALGVLRSEAKMRGATAVIGLRVDHDEISGAGKSMMMVTAMGTAVVARMLPDGPSEPDTPGYVTAEALVDRVRYDWIIARAADGTLAFTDTDWDALITQRISEAAPAVLRHQGRIAAQSSPEVALALENRVREFFRSLPPEEVTRQLYEILSTSGDLAPMATKLIIENQCVDLVRVNELVGRATEERETAVNALQTLRAHPRLYAADDLEKMQTVKEIISRVFGSASLMERPRMLSSKSRSVWSCSCGLEVEADEERCGRCGRDRFGFVEGQLIPEDAVATLDRRIVALRALLNPEEEEERIERA